jgi:hypothetical protein
VNDPAPLSWKYRTAVTPPDGLDHARVGNAVLVQVDLEHHVVRGAAVLHGHRAAVGGADLPEGGVVGHAVTVEVGRDGPAEESGRRGTG